MTTTNNNFSMKPEAKPTRSDYIIFSIVGIVTLLTFSYILNEAITYLLVNAFGYTNFEVRFSEYTKVLVFLLVSTLMFAFPLAIIYKLLKTYGLAILSILAVTATMFFIKTNGLTTEQYAYQSSLNQFENKYLLSGNKDTMDAQHPDMISFYAYKENNILTETARRDYFKQIATIANQLDDISRYTTVYNLGFVADYFISKQDSDKFFMAYSDVKDPELRSKLNELMITPLVKTSDYVAFHSAYRQQFIKDNSSLTAGNVNAANQSDTKKERMTDLQNISSIIHFFNNNNVDSLLPVKTEFLSLISQPSVTIADVDSFRSKLTNVLKADPALYSLMAQL